MIDFFLSSSLSYVVFQNVSTLNPFSGFVLKATTLPREFINIYKKHRQDFWYLSLRCLKQYLYFVKKKKQDRSSQHEK